MISYLISLSSLLFFASLSSMDHKVHMVIIPGQNGLGGDYIDTSSEKRLFDNIPLNNIHRASTPGFLKADFGHSRCMADANETINPLTKDDNCESIILHGSSQGTATTCLIAALKNNDKIKALILESVMLSGNSTIAHTLCGTPQCSSIKYYTLAYLAKLAYPFYNPAGKHVIDTCDTIDDNLPIIIMHAPDDFQISCQDGLAFYAHLKNKGHKNVYFIENNNLSGHVNLVDPYDTSHSKTQNQLYTILNKHISDLEISDTQRVSIAHTQPQVDQKWIDHFNLIKQREDTIKKYNPLFLAMPTVVVGAVASAFIWLAKSLLALPFKGLKQIGSTEDLEAMVLDIIAKNPSQVEAYRGDKDKLFGFFVGQMMQRTQGKGNPQLINELIKKHLNA